MSTKKPAATKTRKRKPRRSAAADQSDAVTSGPSAAVAIAAKPAAVAVASADKKPQKPRPALVRDSFTMPTADFALVASLRATALGAQRAVKKSELLRAGLHALAAMDAAGLVAMLDRLETVKTGRPKKGH